MSSKELPEKKHVAVAHEIYEKAKGDEPVEA